MVVTSYRTELILPGLFMLAKKNDGTLSIEKRYRSKFKVPGSRYRFPLLNLELTSTPIAFVPKGSVLERLLT